VTSKPTDLADMIERVALTNLINCSIETGMSADATAFVYNSLRAVAATNAFSHERMLQKAGVDRPFQRFNCAPL